MHRMHSPWQMGGWEVGGGGGLKKNVALGARFQRGGQSLEGTMFLQTCYFCGNIFNYSYHYVYSNIVDIAESLTQNDHGPI